MPPHRDPEYTPVAIFSGAMSSPDAFSRRTFLAVSGGALAAATGQRSPAPSKAPKPKLVVVGAGAFGGFAAYFLRREGADVTLLDAWGPGNARASSAGETRVIRGIYGPNRIYISMVVRALALWKELQARWGSPMYFRTGALWMVRRGVSPDLVTGALPILAELGLATEKLSPEEAKRRFPVIDFDGLDVVLLEREGGFLLAREACRRAVDAFQKEGGRYRQAQVVEAPIRNGRLAAVRLADGSEVPADAFVFACGPWLGTVFPDVVGTKIRPTRQEVFFFGTPAGDARYSESALPVWVDIGEHLIYGIPGNQFRGFKIADDTRGEAFDPTSGERRVTEAGESAARAFFKTRFPGLADAPLLESRVCQYENSPDGDYILDRHPEAGNVVLAGGGSGHGFKMAPAMGERISRFVFGKDAVEPRFALSRFSKVGG